MGTITGTPAPTSSQVAFYEQNGYIQIPELVDRELMDRFNRHVWSLRADPDPAAWVIARNEDGSVDESKRFSTRLFNPHLNDEFALQMMKLPTIASVLRVLLGKPAVGVQSMYFYKTPGTKGQARHQDYFYIKNEANTLTACWLAMEDADEENGCLWVVPGTNRGPLLRHGAVRNKEEHEEWTHEAEGLRAPKDIPVPMKAGDALFFHNLLVHSSTLNRAAGRSRRAYVCHYIREDSQLADPKLFKRFPLDDDEI
jgi:phytanoyl-CoA hydroxylase